MTKPWEETWTAGDPEHSRGRVNGSDGTELGRFAAMVAHDAADDVARARLASAAPDMARALLAIGRDVEAALADDPTDELAGQHHALIDATLRKAGVR